MTDHRPEVREAVQQLATAARNIFFQREGAMGTALIHRGETDLAYDLETLRACLADYDTATAAYPPIEPVGVRECLDKIECSPRGCQHADVQNDGDYTCYNHRVIQQAHAALAQHQAVVVDEVVTTEYEVENIYSTLFERVVKHGDRIHLIGYRVE